MILHAGLVARRIGGFWRGALILGPSGCGKSDLALRALAAGFRLVADDRVLVWAAEGRLFGRAPDTLAGLIEARGLGVQPEVALRLAPIGLVVRCEPGERVPEAQFEAVLGVQIPLIRLAPLEASAPLKLGMALETLV